MSNADDPFAYHPELRGQIADPETSFFRGFNVPDLLRAHPELDELRRWVHTDAQRETRRRAALAGHTGDLWIFAYGSLMWDPALRFVELRRARLEGFARRFILMDDKGGRGTKEAPGLMAALDVGAGCDGIAFRIRAAEIETETEILCRRELIGPGYSPVLCPVQIADQTVTALTFIADHGVAEILGDLPRAQQLRYLGTGAGILGTSRDYLASIVAHFDLLEIEDPHCTALLREVDDWIAAQTAKDFAQ